MMRCEPHQAAPCFICLRTRIEAGNLAEGDIPLIQQLLDHQDSRVDKLNKVLAEMKAIQGIADNA